MTSSPLADEGMNAPWSPPFCDGHVVETHPLHLIVYPSTFCRQFCPGRCGCSYLRQARQTSTKGMHRPQKCYLLAESMTKSRLPGMCRLTFHPGHGRASENGRQFPAARAQARGLSDDIWAGKLFQLVIYPLFISCRVHFGGCFARWGFGRDRSFPSRIVLGRGSGEPLPAARKRGHQAGQSLRVMIRTHYALHSKKVGFFIVEHGR